MQLELQLQPISDCASKSPQTPIQIGLATTELGTMRLARLGWLKELYFRLLNAVIYHLCK